MQLSYRVSRSVQLYIWIAAVVTTGSRKVLLFGIANIVSSKQLTAAQYAQLLVNNYFTDLYMIVKMKLA